ncbi:hypothetical protein [Streptomyces coeruleorubidus]|uniref:hypothetical protein n=1 Tax=Streptomyces coeruleorubidus TaxID=116188 RepID=UPI0037A34DE8
MPDVSVASTVLSAGVGAVFGLVAAAFKSFLDARRKVDEDLRAKRGPGYQELWQYTKLFGEYSDGQVNCSQVEELQRNLRNWMYGDVGLYLSSNSQSAYGDLMKSLSDARDVTGGEGATSEPTDELPEAKSKDIREKCVKLRKALTGDLLASTSGKRRF